MISRALSVYLTYNDWRLQFYWPGLSPPLTGGDYSIRDVVKCIASIRSIGTKRLILLSAQVFAYAFFSWLEICSIKFNMLSSSTPKILPSPVVSINARLLCLTVWKTSWVDVGRTLLQLPCFKTPKKMRWDTFQFKGTF